MFVCRNDEKLWVPSGDLEYGCIVEMCEVEVAPVSAAVGAHAILLDKRQTIVLFKNFLAIWI